MGSVVSAQSNSASYDQVAQIQLTFPAADLTPVPTQWFNGLERNYIKSSREHTCRDFGRVREWATERFNGSTAVKARNRDGSLRANFYEPWTP